MKPRQRKEIDKFIKKESERKLICKCVMCGDKFFQYCGLTRFYGKLLFRTTEYKTCPKCRNELAKFFEESEKNDYSNNPRV